MEIGGGVFGDCVFGDLHRVTVVDYMAASRDWRAWMGHHRGARQPIPGQLQKVADILRGLREIVECDRITGEDCFIARAHVQSVDDLEKLIDQVIPYAMTNTSIIQSSPVKRRLPPILRGDRL
jgi:DNA-binding Lrp family transcriptional regulator